MLNMKTLLLKNGSSAVIREAEANDAEGIINTINSVGAEKIYILTEKFSHNVDSEKDYIQEHVKEKKDVLFAVVEAEGNIIGMSAIHIGNNPKNSHVGGLGINILKDWRGLGIGTALMKYMMYWAKSRGLEKLDLEVFSTNQRAIHLYEKFNFQVEGIRKKQYKIEGKYVDEITMAKFLD